MGNRSTRFFEMDPELQQAWRESSFTVKEIEVWYDDFITRHPSGQINLIDFKKMYRELNPTGNPDAFAAYVFKLFDVDQDSLLSFREFICGISMTSLQNPKDRMDWVFKMYDLDKDGYITIQEMTQILQAIFKMNPNPTTDLILKLPLGCDEITPEKITKRIFEKYDGDQDGKLSKAEMYQSVQDDPYLSKLLS